MLVILNLNLSWLPRGCTPKSCVVTPPKILSAQAVPCAVAVAPANTTRTRAKHSRRVIAPVIAASPFPGNSSESYPSSRFGERRVCAEDPPLGGLQASSRACFYGGSLARSGDRPPSFPVFAIYGILPN